MNKAHYISFAFVVFFTGIIYSNHFNNEFHFDDSHTIQNNVFIKNIKNIPLFFTDARTFSNLPQNQSYRPIVSTTLALDYWLGNGYNLFYFHLSTFILFLLQGILMFVFFYKIFNNSIINKKENNFPVYLVSLFAVSWYMFHPANAETINYIIARSDLQSTFFVVLAFILYLYSPISKRLYLYLLPVGIGALAKPTAIMFAPLFLFYIILFEEEINLYNVFLKIDFNKLKSIFKKTFPAFIFCMALYFFVDRMTPITWKSGGSSVISYLITQPFVIAHYFGIFFVPAGLSADTDWGLLEGIWNIRFFAGVLFIISMLWITFYCSRKRELRPISFGILWFFISLIPTSSIIPFSEVLNYHRVFFPFVGLVISASWSVNLLVNKYWPALNSSGLRPVTVIAVLCFLVPYAWNTFERNKVWRTEETLWHDVTVKSPNNGRGMMNYGLVKMATGDYLTAEKYFTEAFKTLPYYFSLYINMGILKNATGDKITAEACFKHALEYGASYPDAWFYYARYLCQWHRYEEATPMLTRAIELSPAYLNARMLLLKVYNETAQWDKLDALALDTRLLDPENNEVREYEKASKNRKTKIEIVLEDLKKFPTAEKYLNLSLAYYESQKYSDCIRSAIEALKFNPDCAEAYNNLGSAYNQLHEYNKAIAMCRKALSIKPDFLLASNNMADATYNLNLINESEKIALGKPSADNYLNLSLVYYNLGMYDKCIEACNKALAVKPDFDLAYNNICSSYNRLGYWDQAIAAGERGLKINSNNILIQNNLTESRQKKQAEKKL